ncbi:MAG TPA: glycosyl hydrolase family 18 protein, partial [Caulobacteraceae bacterium]|nr:glycosyl hydrolase family 18 protein [Caulobacteraceae bacterium]
MDDFVFHDPTGRRARRANFGVGLLVALAALVVAGFFATLAFAPRLPNLQMKDPRDLRALHVETAHRQIRALRAGQEWRRLPKPRATAAGSPSRPLSVGFYVSWDESSRVSLARNIDKLDVVSPQWIGLDGSLGRVNVTSDPQAEAMIARAKNPPPVMPMIHNAHDGLSDGPVADRLLMNPAARTALVTNLVTLAQQRGYAGYVFDLENMNHTSLADYPALVAEARAALKPLGREVWVSVPVADDAWDLKKFAAAADSVVLMAYDQHWAAGKPGPAAGQDWYEAIIEQDFKKLDPAHTIVALGDYGYDWTLPDATQPGRADTEVFYDATQTAHDAEATIQLDDNALNPHYAYQDDDGRKHEVWFLDAATVFNQIKVTDPFRPQGYALWRMGAEDPGVWKFFRQPYGAVQPKGLETIDPSTGVDFEGTGEILHVSSTPTGGTRTIEIDPDNGLISGETYTSTPTSYVIQRYGAHPGYVALTFDDGPDGRWTPKILD